MKFKRFLAVALTLMMLAGMMPGTLPDIVRSIARSTTSSVAYAATYIPMPGPTPSTGGNQKHTHSFKRVKRVEPTCTKSGYDLYKCSGCGKTKRSYKSALGHKFGSWKVTRQADCTHTGVKTRKCARCGKTETQTIKKTDHSFSSWKVTKEATCAKTGTRERKCKVCGKTQTDTIGRIDHKYSEWTTTVAPNCAHTGTRERTCKVCGKTQTDTLRKTDHIFGEWSITVPATDHSAGTRSRTCEVCGLEETEDFDPDGTLRRGDTGEDVRALQEDLTCYGTLTGYADGDFGEDTEKAVRATQQAEGFEADGVAWPQTQNVLGHRFGEWETVSELSDFSKLERRRVCQRCGYTETEEEWPSPLYRHGDSGDGVKALQQALNDAGYNCGWPDGDFGDNTERAVARIETAHGVDGDGIAWPGVLKWLNLTSGGDDEDEDNDQDDVAGGITTYNAPKTAPEDPDYPVMPDMAEPFVLLTHEPVGVVDIKVGDTLDVLMHVQNTGDIPVKLKSIDLGVDETYSDETWMSGELEPGGTYDFTYHIRIVSNDTKPSSSYRNPMVTVVDPVTKRKADCVDWIAFSRKKSGARIAVIPDRSHALKGVMGMELSVPVTVMNNGDVALENLSFSWLNSKSGDRPSDSVKEISDETLIGHMEPGKVLTLYYMIHIVGDDVGSSAYSASRKFTVSAKPADGKGAVNDSFGIGFTVVESNQAKVSVVKEEVGARPREEGYYPQEKITYKVTVRNDGDRALDVVNLYDPLSNDDSNNFGTITNLKPGKSASRSFEYTVTDPAAEKGYVESAAKAIIDDGVELWTTESNAVKTPCVKKGGDKDGGDTGEKMSKDLELVVTPKDPKITSVAEGDDLKFTLRMINKGDEPLTGAFIRAYDGQGSEREMYYSDLDPLPAGKSYEVEDHYVVTKEDAAGVQLTLNWEAFGKPEGDWLTDDIFLSYDIGAAKPDDGDYGWEPPEEPKPEAEPAVMKPEPVDVGDVTLKLEILTEMKHAAGFVEDDTLVYNIYVENNGEQKIDGVDIWDSLHGFEEGKQTKKGSFAHPSSKTTAHSTYTITKDDVDTGYLEIKGHVEWNDANGEHHEGDTNVAHVPLFAVNLTIEQTVVGGEDQVLHKGDTVEFQLVVKNPSDIDVSTVKVWHRLNNASGTDKGEVLAENLAIPAHGSKTFSIKHEVGDDDVIRGKVTHSGSLWDGLGYGSAHYAYSKGADVAVSPEGHDDLLKPLDIMMKVVGGEDQVFKQDDKIEIEYTVHNPRSADVAAAKIYAYFEGMKDPILVAEGVSIPAHKSVTKTRKFTVTGPDASRGYVRTRGEVLDGLGTTGIHNEFTEWVKLTVEKNADAGKALVVTIAIQGGDDQVFFLDDEIPFEITVENTRDYKLNNAVIRIQLNGKGSTSLVEDHVSIPAHKSVTKQYKYTVTKEDVIRTWVTGMAFADDGIGSGDGHSFKSESVKADIGPSGDLQKPITATKAVKGGVTKEYKENDVIVFEITVNNPKSVDLDHVEIYDYPNNTTHGVAVTNSLFVPAHGSATAEYSYTVTKDDVEKYGYMTNQARVWDGINKKGGKDQYVYTNTVKVNLNGAPTESDTLVVTKTLKEGWTIVHPDNVLTFEIKVFNPNMTTVKNVRVYDHLNGDTEGVLVSEIPIIQPSQIMKRFYKHTVDSDDLARGAIDNYARITWDGQEGEDPVSDTVHLTVEGDALVVTKTLKEGWTTVHPNDELNFEIAITNPNMTPIKNVRVYDHMNGDTEGVLVSEIPIIQPLQIMKRFYKHTVDSDDLTRGAIDNYARAVWDDQKGPDPVSDTVHLTVTSDAPVVTGKPLEITKYVIGGGTEFKVNDKIKYQFNVKNPNTEPATGVKVYDHVNGDPTGALVEGGFTVGANSDYGTGYDYTVTGEDLKRGFIDDYATVTWDGQEGADPTSETVHVTIVGEPAGLKPLTVTKQVKDGADGFYKDEGIVYEITIKNPNDIPAENVTVYDHMNFDPVGSVIFSGITVPANDEAFRTFTHIVDSADVEHTVIDNHVRVHWDDQPSEDVESNNVRVHILKDPEGAHALKVTKAVLGGTEFHVDDVITYTYTITNPTDEPQTVAKVYDHMNGSLAGTAVATDVTVPAHDSITDTFTWVVKTEDLTRGWIEDYIRLYLGGEEGLEPKSNTVHVDIVDGTPKSSGSVSLFKWVTGKTFFLESEVVPFQLFLENHTGATITDVVVTDPLSSAPGKVIASYASIADGEGKNIPFPYTVTPYDAGLGSITNTGKVTYVDAAGVKHTLSSAPVTVYTGKDPDDVTNNRTIVATVVKKVDGDPKNHKYYVEGEKIHYVIHVTYTGYENAFEIVVTDPLKSGDTEVGRVKDVPSGYSGDFDFYYTVTGPDVDHTKVVNVATIAVWMTGKPEPIIIDSLPVTSPTGREKPDEKDGGEPDPGSPTPEPSEQPEPTATPEPIELSLTLADSCVRTLIGKGEGAAEFAQTYCPEHARTADAVKALLDEAEKAGADEARLEAWQQAVTLWTDAVNKEYEEWHARATDVERTIIEQAQAAFFEQLAAHEDALKLAYPDQPETVAMKVSEQLMNQCVELCYEAHTAPDMRADSLGNGLWKPIEAPEAAEPCAREVTPLDVGATYVENLCERHRAAEAAVDALLEDVDTDEALAQAWQDAKQLWLTELDALTNERYLAADAAGRDAIAAERVSFGSWLKALESALTLAYPDKPQVVNEVMAGTIRSRVLDLCGEEQK